MGNIKKINGHDVKDDIARTRADIITEGFDQVITEFELIREEMDNIEGLLGGSLDFADRIDDLEGTILELERNVISVNQGVTANTQEIEDLKSLIGNATIVPPTYTQPTFSFRLSPTYVEHNKLTQVSLIPTFTQNDAGNPTRFEISKDGSRIHLGTTPGNVTDSLLIPHNTTVTYKAIIHFGDGPIKNNTLGSPYPEGAIKAGTLEAQVTIKAYAPCYYGVIDGDFNTGYLLNFNSKISTSRTNVLNFNLERQKSVYMYPASFGELTSIRDANNFNYINSYTKSTIIYNDVEYLVYVLTDPVSITNFEQSFS